MEAATERKVVLSFSLEGIRFLSDRSFSIGEKTQVEFSLGGDPNPVVCEVKAVSCQGIQNNFLVETEFARLKEEDRLRMRRIVVDWLFFSD